MELSPIELVLGLLVVAVALGYVARRIGVAYPILLLLGGLVLGYLPGVPSIELDPDLVFLLLLPPILFGAGYSTPIRDFKANARPIALLAVGLVLFTTLVVGLVAMAIMPFLLPAVAFALGAIVAPPDAVASTAVLGQTALPRHSSLIIRGESLLNDATALLIFGAAVAIAAQTPTSGNLVHIGLAVPGGILFGIVMGLFFVSIAKFFAGTQSSIIIQFTGTFGCWLLADRLQLSPVLAVVADAMIVAYFMPSRISARDRVQSYAVWAAVVFVLNVLAFLLMGLQTRAILSQIATDRVWPALRFAGSILLAVMVVRFVVVFAYYAVVDLVWRRRRPDWIPNPPKWKSAQHWIT
jgi:CPA1 family monovalent cation:H+ antiporter